MARRSFRCDHRGQVLVVSALLVALLLLSTAIYVIEVGKEVPKVEVTQSANFERYKPSVRNAMISALANASNGGDPDVLALNLAELRAVMFAHLPCHAQYGVQYL